MTLEELLRLVVTVSARDLCTMYYLDYLPYLL